MDPIRLGIAGAGIGSLQTVGDLKTLKDKVRLTAIADIRRDNMEYLAGRYGEDVPFFDDVAAMCKSGTIDAVWIATPNSLHLEHTRAAAENGIHVICEKPMAVTLDQCLAMVEAIEGAGVRYVQGHSKVYDVPIREMGKVVRSGALGRAVHIHTWNWNDLLLRGAMPSDLTTEGGSGALFRQGPHQVDIVRYLGGGEVRSLRAVAGRWDPNFPDCEGSYSAFMEFEDGTAASMVFDGYGYFDIRELTWGWGEGARKGLNTDSVEPRERPTRPITPEEKYANVHSGNPYGYGKGSGIDRDSPEGLPFFGLTVVTCERGVVRQSPDGIYVYGADGRKEIPCHTHQGRSGELLELYDALAEDRPTLLDARWGLASMEVCLAILESSAERGEVRLNHQSPAPDM